MADFGSINQAPTGAVPQFQQEQPVSDGKASSMSQITTIASSVFNSAAKASAASATEKLKTTEATALGSLQQKLLDIKMAGETSNIDVTREQRKIMSKFNSEFPALRVDGSKVFKAETGIGPAEANPEEVAVMKLQNEALSNGYGRHDASDKHNEEQLELYIQTKRADKQNAARLQELSLMKTRGDISKDIVKKEVLGGMREMSQLGYKKAASDSQSIIEATGDGSMSIESANLSFRKQRIDINRAVASLGEYSTDPSVQAYIQPILDEIKLAEDIVNGVIERDASKNVISTNKARAQAVFYSDPERLNVAIVSEIFGHTAGLTNLMTGPAYKFLGEGLTKDGMIPTRPIPVNPLSLDDDGKRGIQGTTTNVLTSNDEKGKQEVSAMLSGVAEHLNRNGMDYDSGDKDFVIQLLSTPKAMDSLSSEQKESVMIGLEMYVVDDTKVAADKYITNVPPITVSAPFPISMGGRGQKETKEMVEIADLTVVDGRIFWTIKDKFSSNGKLQNTIRATNRHIAEEVTPVMGILSKGSGNSFEDTAGRVIFGQEEEAQEESVKK